LNYYGATIKNNVHIGSFGANNKALYSIDLIRGIETGYRSGVRFGVYNSSGQVNQFYYGIEYSTAEKLSIGRYSSTSMFGQTTSFDAGKTTTIDSSGNWAFGKNIASYRVDVNGDVNISGMFRLNGSFGADHTFLKSNGTTQEFALMTVGEISDIDTYYASKTFAATNYASKHDAVLYGTFEGERGFKLYHDATKLDTAALFFANQDTGIVGIHYFGLDNSNNVTQHGVHIDGDGFVYHKKLNGSRARFLTTDDSLSGGGMTYSFTEPIYLDGTVKVRTASATQNGVLTKEDWSRFNVANTWNGGVVTNTIDLYTSSYGELETVFKFSSSLSFLGAKMYLNGTSGGQYGPGLNIVSNTSTDISLIAGREFGNENPAEPNRSIYLHGQKIYLNGIELNMTKVASQIGV